MTKTNIIQVMGTNILTIWPHASVVTNLNADMLDGYHATNLPYMGTNYQFVEQDPQVGEIASNYVPHWVGTSLITGTIYDNGKIGIGTATPNARLEIANTSGETLRLEKPTGAALQFTRSGTAGYQIDDNAGSIRFLSAGSTERVRIDTAGNVGVGTVTPDGKIDLQAGSGGTAITISANYPDSYRWRMIPTDRGNAIDLDFTVSDSSDAQERLLQLSHSTSGRPEFALLNNQLVVNNGNVGIGISPAYKLDVNGSAIIRGGTLGIAGGWNRIQAVGTGDYPPYLDLARFDHTVLKPHVGSFGVRDAVDGRDNMQVLNDGTVRAYKRFVAPGFDSESDDRLKFNKQKLEYGLDKVMALETWRYDRAEWEYNEETEEIVIHPEKISRTNEIGLVAQDVQRVIPEAVNIPEDEDRELWSLSYDTIIPVLVKAIQEQQSQIKSLKQRIETLEQR